MINIPLRRDTDGCAHIVALSGGKDSTAMALRLGEIEPRPYTFVCTPTGDELPEMFAHWRNLSKILGETIWPLAAGTLNSICDEEKALPNWRMRFCTRRLKIEPWKRLLLAAIPSVSYVGLRADEDLREGIDLRPSHHGGSVRLSAPGAVEQRYPLRDWGWNESDVWNYLGRREVEIPERTDCARCFFQTLAEWWALYKNHPGIYADAEAQEARFGHTFRSPGRDSWPTGLVELRQAFESGRVPRGVDLQIDLFRKSTCRTCTM